MLENCYYELVFNSQSQKPIFEQNIMTDLHSIFTEVADDMGFEIKKISGSLDQVQVLVSLDSQHSILNVVRGLKDRAGEELMSKYDHLRQEVDETIWEKGYKARGIYSEVDSMLKLEATIDIDED